MRNRVVFNIAGLLVWAAALICTAEAATITLHTGQGKQTRVDAAAFVTRGADNQASFGGADITWLSEPGQPAIPWKLMRVLLKPNTDLATVTCHVNSAQWAVVEGMWDVAPTGPLLTRDPQGQEIEVWPPEKTIVNGRDSAIYAVDASWPPENVRLSGKGKIRQWHLAEVAVPLFAYNPVTGQLQQLIDADIAIESHPKGNGRRSSTNGQQKGLKRIRPLGRDRARGLTVNFDQEAGEYDAELLGAAGDTAESVPLAAPADSGEPIAASVPPDADGYAIITTDAIINNSQKLADFITLKENLGFTVTVVDQYDTGAAAAGPGDPSATALRTWLQNNYLALNLKYVLIIGDPRLNSGYVPMKLFPCGGRNIPTDYFYAELTADWDADGDGIIGESGEIERYFEVYVGRIPYYGSITDLDAILQKTISYHLQTDILWRYKALLPMVPLSSVMESYDLGQEIRANILIPNMFACDRVYRDGYGHVVTAYGYNPPPEYSTSWYPATVWSQNDYGLVTWITHGWAMGAEGIMSSGNAPNLDNNYPSIVYQGSCENAYPEYTDNLSYSLLRNGAVGAVGATRISYYSGAGYTDSPTIHGMGYRFTKGNVEGRSAGEALWLLKEETSGWWDHNWTVMNLYGDPSVSLTKSYEHYGQVGHWSLDDGGGSGAADASGNGFDATLGSSETWTAGILGGALQYPATESPTTAVPNLLPSDQLSFCAWFNNAGTDSHQYFAKGLNSGSNEWGIYRYGGSGHIQIDTPGDSSSSWYTKVTPSDNQWHHLAVVFDVRALTVRLYLDGVLRGSRILYGGAMVDKTLKQVEWGAGVNGMMDDVRLYDEALTTQEVQILYAMGVPVASDPRPTHEATGVAQNAVLSWIPADGFNPAVDTHKVYLGPSQASMTLVGTVSEPAFDPALEWASPYYWRVDEVMGGTTYSGLVWTFTTTGERLCDPPLIADTNDDCVVDMTDLAQMAADWLVCTHISGSCN